MTNQIRHNARLMVVLLALLTACSDEQTSSTDNTLLTIGATVPGTTRAGATGTIDNQTLTTCGFGVFAYGGDDTTLFDNQKVTYGDSYDEWRDVHLHPNYWNYGAQKEWPKGTKYSFYAYAPYVSAGASEAGITSVTSNSSGPTVGYQVATDPSASVDLLWGVNGMTGLPWTEQTRDSNGGLVLFTFHHALAALGLHVQAMVDQDNNLTDLGDESPTGSLGTDCKVTLQDITITPKTNQFYASGTLNQKNTTANVPLWTLNAADRTVDKLTLSSGQIDNALIDQGDKAPSEMATPGVTATANSQTVIKKDGSGREQYVMLIPDDAQDYDVTVEYYVTYKTSDATPAYKRIGYTGTSARKATFSGLALKSDTRYYLNLVIGLTTFNLSVTAEDWQGSPVDVDIKIENGTSANSSLAPSR